MVHSTCGQTCGWQVKLCDPLITRAIPERFRDEFLIEITLYKSTVTLLRLRYFTVTDSGCPGWDSNLGSHTSQVGMVPL